MFLFKKHREEYVDEENIDEEEQIRRMRFFYAFALSYPMHR